MGESQLPGNMKMVELRVHQDVDVESDEVVELYLEISVNTASRCEDLNSDRWLRPTLHNLAS